MRPSKHQRGLWVHSQEPQEARQKSRSSRGTWGTAEAALGDVAGRAERGPRLSPDECGIVAQISEPLAAADIPAYYISTFKFDHALVSVGHPPQGRGGPVQWLPDVYFPPSQVPEETSTASSAP